MTAVSSRKRNALTKGLQIIHPHRYSVNTARDLKERKRRRILKVTA
jgi:hypothetical protein